MFRTLFVSFGLLSASLSLLGCGNSSTSDDAGTNANCADFSNLPTSPTISFRADVMPILALSCIASSCHDTSAKKADLVLGDPSACTNTGPTGCFDPNSKWKYTFLAPPPEALVQQVLGNLVNVASKTNPAVMRIVSGNPQTSFLLDKITGQENSKQYPGTCTNQDLTHSSTPCGTDMPLGQPGGFCGDTDPLSAQKVQAIAQWVAANAQNN